MLVIQAAVALPLVLWLIFRLTLPAGPYNMDPCGKGTFFPHLIFYSVFAYAQVLAGIYGATWSYSFVANFWPSAMFLFAAIYAFLFAGVLAFFYEGYMASNYPPGRVGASNYTVTKYSLVLALGFSSITLLIGAALWTATELGR